VTYSATATGFGSATGTVTLRPSGFVISTGGPSGIGGTFLTTTGASNTDLTIYSARLSPSLAIEELQPVRSGLTVSVPVTSSSASVGTITGSPVVFTAGNSQATTQFDPVGGGTAIITAGTPAGFSTPATGASVTATVIAPAMNISVGSVIGQNLQEFGRVLLGQPAPAGGLPVTLTASTGLLVSSSPTTAGSSSIVVTVPGGGSGADFYLQGANNSGTATITATAAGYQPRTLNITLAPSGVVIAPPFGFGFDLITRPGLSQPVTVFTALLAPGTLEVVQQQALAGGQSLQVNLTSSNPAVGTIASPVTITGGSDNVNATFTPLAVGETTITAVPPAGYATPSEFRTVLARVNP
jgi:hypothetical protein